MCRVGGMINTAGKSVGELRESILELLSRMTCQGRDSFGVALVLPDGSVKIGRWVGDASKPEVSKSAYGWLSSLAGVIPKGVITHTRLATHGAVDKQNAHPHRTGSWSLVHNGIISGIETKTKGRKSVPAGYCDSKMAVDYLSQIDNIVKTPQAAMKGLCERVDGGFAFITYRDKQDAIFSCRDFSRPLSFGRSEDGNLWLASTVQLFSHVVDKKDAETTKSYHIYEFKFDGKVEKTEIDAPNEDWGVWNSAYGGYRDRRSAGYGRQSRQVVSVSDNDFVEIENPLSPVKRDEGGVPVAWADLEDEQTYDFSEIILGEEIYPLPNVLVPSVEDAEKGQVFLGQFGPYIHMVYIPAEVEFVNDVGKTGWYVIQGDIALVVEVSTEIEVV